MYNLIRTTKPIPQKNGTSFYFEAKIVKGCVRCSIVIGLTEADPNTRTNCLPGYDYDKRERKYRLSTLGIGYRGGNGGIYTGTGHLESRSDTFTAGDIVGCLVHINGMNGTHQESTTVEFTKNGKLGPISPVHIKNAVWYPTIGIAEGGAVVETNFGEHPFRYSDMSTNFKNFFIIFVSVLLLQITKKIITNIPITFLFSTNDNNTNNNAHYNYDSNTNNFPR